MAKLIKGKIKLADSGRWELEGHGVVSGTRLVMKVGQNWLQGTINYVAELSEYCFCAPTMMASLKKLVNAEARFFVKSA